MCRRRRLAMPPPSPVIRSVIVRGSGTGERFVGSGPLRRQIVAQALQVEPKTAQNVVEAAGLREGAGDKHFIARVLAQRYLWSIRGTESIISGCERRDRSMGPRSIASASSRHLGRQHN